MEPSYISCDFCTFTFQMKCAFEVLATISIENMKRLQEYGAILHFLRFLYIYTSNEIRLGGSHHVLKALHICFILIFYIRTEIKNPNGRSVRLKVNLSLMESSYISCDFCTFTFQIKSSLEEGIRCIMSAHYQLLLGLSHT